MIDIVDYERLDYNKAITVDLYLLEDTMSENLHKKMRPTEGAILKNKNENPYLIIKKKVKVKSVLHSKS